MTDIVERLAEASGIKQYASLENGCAACGVDANLLTEAADEIERLRQVLHLAVEWDGYDSEGVPAVWLAEAEAALGTANTTANTADAATNETDATS